MKLPDPLALRELSALLRDPVFRGRGVHRGDGRSILLVPGFLSGDWSLTVMHGWLQRIGYVPHPSGINFNVRASEHMLAGLARPRAGIQATCPAPRTLIGRPRECAPPQAASPRRADEFQH